MIEQKELRLGNWVKDTKTNSFVQVEGLQFTGRIVVSDDTYDDGKRGIEPEPIPLSPEILEKAGFEIDEERRAYKLKNSSFMVVFKEGKFFYYNYCDEDDYYSSYWPEITSLHHMQNFYYVVNGEELPIALLAEK